MVSALTVDLCSVDCDVDRVTEFVESHCPGAALMSDIGSSITYSLPATQLPSFEKLFEDLSANLSRLSLAGYGVSDSTLYEVYCQSPSGFSCSV